MGEKMKTKNGGRRQGLLRKSTKRKGILSSGIFAVLLVVMGTAGTLQASLGAALRIQNEQFASLEARLCFEAALIGARSEGKAAKAPPLPYKLHWSETTGPRGRRLWLRLFRGEQFLEEQCIDEQDL